MMLEIRYNTKTGEVTGWWGSRWGNHEIKLKNRPDEVIVVSDIAIPGKSCGAYLYDKNAKSLIDNPDYIEPEPPRDFGKEIDELKVKVNKFETKI